MTRRNRRPQVYLGMTSERLMDRNMQKLNKSRPVTFQDIRAQVDKMEIRHGSLASRLDNVLDCARINADDTIYVEKAAAASSWDRIAMDTVVSILSYETDKRVRAWFAKQGIVA